MSAGFISALSSWVVLFGLITLPSDGQAQEWCNSDALVKEDKVNRPPFGNLPDIRRKTTVPGHENEICYSYTIQEIRDPRYDSYCETTHTDCYDPVTGVYTYFSEMERSCREWPTEPLPVPDRNECRGEASDPEPEKDYFSCENNADRASWNCMQEAHCNYGIGLIECHNAPPGHGIREVCYANTSEQLRDAIYACQVAYSSAIAQCEQTWPSDHNRQASCLRRAARLREMADWNCYWVRKPGEVTSCLEASEQEYERRRRLCIASE